MPVLPQAEEDGFRRYGFTAWWNDDRERCVALLAIQDNPCALVWACR